MVNSQQDELITVVQVFRHGERNPLTAYKIPIFEYNGELGALTKTGKRQIYDLGRYTRDRYKNLLPAKYHSRHYQILSSSSERTLTSAQLFSAGLYPITEEEVWNEDLKWDPIPVKFAGRTLSINDPAEYFHPTFKNLVEDHATKLFERWINEGLLEYVVRNIGEDLRDARDMLLVADACIFADKSGISLPQWAQKIYPQPLRATFDLYFEAFYSTPETRRIYVGPFFHKLITHFTNMSTKTSSGPKLLVYSIHEVNIMGILNTLNVRISEWPSYAACLYFELWKRKDGYYVKLYIKNLDKMTELVIGEDVDCKLEEMAKLVKDYSVTEEDLMREAFKIEG